MLRYRAPVHRDSAVPPPLIVRVVRDDVRFAVPWSTEAPFRIGRGLHNDLVLGDPMVSTHHVQLECTAQGTLRAVDLGSRNGTWARGERVHGATELLPGERLRLGDATEVVLVRASLPPDTGHPITPTAQAVAYLFTVEVQGSSARPSAVVHHHPSQTTIRFRPSHAATVLMMLAERANEADRDSRWVSDDDLRVGLWGRRGLLGDPNNLNVVLYRLRSRLRSCDISEDLVGKDTHRSRLLDATVRLRLSTRGPH